MVSLFEPNRSNESFRQIYSIPFYDYYFITGHLVLALGVAGVINCTLCLIFVLAYLNHKLIRATCSFISILIIFALLIGNVPLFLLTLAQPSPMAYTLIPALHGLCYGIVYASLFVKILRLVRVLHSSKSGIRNPKYINNNSIILQASILAAFNVCFTNFYFTYFRECPFEYAFK